MQLTIVGGGGFRVPAMIDVLARSRAGQGAYASLDVDRVVLYDTDARRLDAMMAVLSSLDFPHSPTVRATTDINEALPGADFVFSAMRVGGTCGRVLDEHCGLDNGLLGQETVGVGGYCYAFRSLGPALELAHAAKRLCPDAWLINFTNPAGIITQAMRSVLGERVIGICDTPIGLVNRTLNALDIPEEERADVSFDYVGLNHLGWLRSLSVGGRDVLPRLFADEAALGSMEESRAIGTDWIRALGALPNEYLFYYYCHREAMARIHQDQTRGEYLRDQQEAFYNAVLSEPEKAGRTWIDVLADREATYMAEARDVDERSGRRAEDIAGGGYQKVALDLMNALATNTPARMILNVGNSDGGFSSIPTLRDTDVVEVPCDVDASGVHPIPVAPLSGAALGLVQSVKACENLVIDAARERDRTLAWQALALHPLVDSVNVARDVLDQAIRTNPLVAAAFGKIGFLDRALYDYRQHGDNVLGAKKGGALSEMKRRLGLSGESLKEMNEKSGAAYRALFLQAEEFRRQYGKELPAEAKKTLDDFLALQHKTRIGKAVGILRGGFTFNLPHRTLGELLFL